MISGCATEGIHYDSGYTWSADLDQCERRFCLAGVMTKAKDQCVAPCKYPVKLPGRYTYASTANSD